MTYKWLVKLRRYDGSTSIVSAHAKEFDARMKACHLNTEYQTTSHYVERYDPTKALS